MLGLVPRQQRTSEPPTANHRRTPWGPQDEIKPDFCLEKQKHDHTASKVCKTKTGTQLSLPTELLAKPVHEPRRTSKGSPPTPLYHLHMADRHGGMHIHSWNLHSCEGRGEKQGKPFKPQTKVRTREQILDKGSTLL